MKNNKMNKYMMVGILINSITILAKQLTEIPGNLACFGTGLGLTLLIFGIFVANRDMTKARNFKKNLMRKILSIK